MASCHLLGLEPAVRGGSGGGWAARSVQSLLEEGVGVALGPGRRLPQVATLLPRPPWRLRT